MEYRFKKDSEIDAYGDTENVIHFKFGDCRKAFNFTKDFTKEHPKFVKEYKEYWMGKESAFTDPLSVVNYIDLFKLPIRLYANFYDEEFEDIEACKEWICNEWLNNRYKLCSYTNGKTTGLDGEVAFYDL